MKIVYLIAGTYRPAGMEKVLSQKAAHFAARGDEVVIVTTDQRGQKPVFGLEKFRQIDLGINYELNNGGSLLSKLLQYPVKQLKHRIRLSRVLKAEKADVVVCMFNNDAAFAWKISDGSRKLLEAHFSRYKMLQYGRTGLWAIVDRWRSRQQTSIAAHYDRFVVLTEEDRGYWLKDGRLDPKKVLVVPNSRTFEAEAPALLKAHTVLAAGRYTHQKGFDLLIKAWEKVNRGDWKLRIAGDGNISDIADNVSEDIASSIITGPAENMRKEYENAAIFVLSSRYEGLPMVLLEAQAAGLPMISFNCKCGPSEIITMETIPSKNGSDADGILIPAEDVEALASAIQRLIDDQSLRTRMGAAAFQNSARFDQSTIMSRWDQILSELTTKESIQ